MGKDRNKSQEAAVLKHSNQLSEIPLQGFTGKEINLFWGMMYKIQGQVAALDEIKNDQIIRASVGFNELREVLGIERRGNDKLKRELMEMSAKFSKINLLSEDEDSFVIVNPFSDFAGTKDGTLTFGVHPEIAKLIYGLDGSPGKRYTLSDIIGISRMKSTFSKECLKMLYLYRSTGYWYTTVDGLRYYLSIPKGYKPNDIKRRVIEVIEAEFTESGLFEEFEVQERKEEAGERAGRKRILGYTFHFTFKEEGLPSEFVPEKKIYCPLCQKPLERIARKDGTGYFWGHKDGYLKNAPCKYTTSEIVLDDYKVDATEVDEAVTIRELREYYRYIQEQERAAADKRKEEIKKNEPEIWALFEEKERRMADYVTQIGLFASPDEKTEFVERKAEAEKALGDALEKKDYSRDYMELWRRCPECKDTGMRDDGTYCSCRKDRMEEAVQWLKAKK